MNSVLKFSFVFILIVLVSCQNEPLSGDNTKLTGLWKLHIMEIRDSVSGEWSEWRDGMQGYLLYDNQDNMSLHLLKKGYQDTDLIFPNFIDTIPLPALKHITGNYNYFAKYMLDTEKQTVQHARISHSNPSDWNKVVTRKYRFSGDTLILQPAEKRIANLRLKWLKEK